MHFIKNQLRDFGKILIKFYKNYSNETIELDGLRVIKSPI